MNLRLERRVSLKIALSMKIRPRGDYFPQNSPLWPLLSPLVPSSGLLDSECFYISAFILFGQSSKLDFIHDHISLVLSNFIWSLLQSPVLWVCLFSIITTEREFRSVCVKCKTWDIQDCIPDKVSKWTIAIISPGMTNFRASLTL